MYSKVKTLLFLSVLSLLLQACSKPELAELNNNATVLAFGDSLTFGYGVKPHQSYPAVLAQMTGLKVVNAGVSGETTQQGLKRLATELDKNQPTLVILLEGGNDVLRKVSEPQIKANLAQMIELIQSYGAQVVLIGVPEKKLFGSSLPLYEELADEYDLALEEDIIANLIKRPSMKSDFVHFNAKGYEALAAAVFELLQQHGALDTEAE